MIRPVMLLLLASGLLAACELDAKIAVVPHGTTPRFVVTYDGGKTACVQGLTVTALDGSKRQDVWAVRRGDNAPCTDRIDFGITPPGYEAPVALHPLSTGRSYEVSATGTGWHAVQPLTVP